MINHNKQINKLISSYFNVKKAFSGFSSILKWGRKMDFLQQQQKIHFLSLLIAKIKLDNGTNLIHRFVDIPLFDFINKEYSIKTL